MALLTLNLESRFLRGNTDVNVILPDKPRDMTSGQFYGSGEKFKILWLLHGSGGDFSDWVRKSRVELFACENNLAVVMPSAQNSQYTGWPTFCDGFDVFHYILDELMPLVYAWFPVSDRREDNFIAGLSMGGNGACKFAFTHPEKFGGAAVFSSCPRDYRTFFRNDAMLRTMKANLEDNLRENAKALAGKDDADALLSSPDDTRCLLDRIIREGRLGELPPMLYTFGDKDRHFHDFTEFLQWCEARDYHPDYLVAEGYAHEWRFWDLSLEKALRYFGFQVREQNRWTDGGTATR